MTSSAFNKKRWLYNHLDQILALKTQGLTLQAIIERLIKTEHMPFALTESLLSRYLKEFSDNQSSTLKTTTALENKIERQRDRITQQNNQIQNLNRRLERILERNEILIFEREETLERNRLLEKKFLDGEARLKDLRRYNGYNNVHWKVADLTEKNDEMLQSILMLERLSERLAKPHEENDEKIRQLTADNDELKKKLENSHLKINFIKKSYDSISAEKEKNIAEIQKLEQKIDHLEAQNSELSEQLSEVPKQSHQSDLNKIIELTNDRKKLIAERSELQMLSRRLRSDLSNSEHQRNEIKHDLYIVESHAKQRDLWRILAILMTCSTILLIIVM